MTPQPLFGSDPASADTVSASDPAFSDTPLNVADTEAVGVMGNVGDAPVLPMVGPMGNPGEHNSAAIQPSFSS